MGSFQKSTQLTTCSGECVCACVCVCVCVCVYSNLLLPVRAPAALFSKAKTHLVWCFRFQDLKPLYANRCHYVPKTSQKEAEEVRARRRLHVLPLGKVSCSAWNPLSFTLFPGPTACYKVCLVDLFSGSEHSANGATVIG